jgi:hypothetical protein
MRSAAETHHAKNEERPNQEIEDGFTHSALCLQSPEAIASKVKLLALSDRHCLDLDHWTPRHRFA